MPPLRPTRFAWAVFQASLTLVCGLLLAAAGTEAADWPQFRGPHRDGVWREKGILKSFPEAGLKICWRHPIQGGWSSPVVTRGRVFVSDAFLNKPIVRERVHCFEEKTGKVLWVYDYPEHYSDWAFDPERGPGPTATPIVERGRVYCVGANGYVHCLEAKTGRVVWENQLERQYQVAEMSCRPSPLIEGNLLIVFTGAKPGASLLALNKWTGKEAWKALDDPVSSSSPIVISAGGKRQLIVWSNTALTSLDPASGRVYWREAMVTSGNDSVPTPVWEGNRLLVSGLMLELSADRPAATVLWPENRAPSKRLLSNTSTPVLQGDYIYSARSSGALVCLESATGRQLWSTNSVTKPKTGASIHLTLQGGGFFLFTDEGYLIRARLTPAGYRETSRVYLIDPTWPFAGTKYVYAPLAFADRCVFARNESEIVCASMADRFW